MASRLIVPALLLVLGAAPLVTQAADFRFYRTVRHSAEITLEGRTVDQIRKLRPVDPHGLKLGAIDGVLVDDGGPRTEENAVAAIILDLRGKIAKNKKVVVGIDDVKFDPTNKTQIIINKTTDDLRAMPTWGTD